MNVNKEVSSSSWISTIEVEIKYSLKARMKRRIAEEFSLGRTIELASGKIMEYKLVIKLIMCAKMYKIHQRFLERKNHC